MTKVFGHSDDLVEFSGDFEGEVNYYNSSEETPLLVVMSDGTILKCWYYKDHKAIWGIGLLHRGSLFNRIEPCVDEDDRPYSDIAYFEPGIKWAYVASEWVTVLPDPYNLRYVDDEDMV